MRVVSWNLQGEIGISDRRMLELLEFVDARFLDSDLLLFQAVNFERTEDGDWGGQLGITDLYGSHGLDFQNVSIYNCSRPEAFVRNRGLGWWVHPLWRWVYQLEG